MIRSSFKYIVFSLLLIVLGVTIIIFWSYKENVLLSILSYLLIFFGWIFLIYNLIGKYYIWGKVSFKRDRKIWLNKILKNFLFYIIIMIGISWTIVVTGNFANKRYEKILCENSQETIAKVIKLESRHTRAGWKEWAIFEYNVKGKVYLKGFYNNKNKYKLRDKYFILYSQEYPEIIELEDRIEE